MSTELKAVLYSAAPPTERQRARLEDFILRRHGSPLPLKWRASDMPRGFRLEIGQEVYDWTPEGQLRQLENCIDQALDDREGESAGLSLLWDTVRSFRPSPFLEETGEVLYAGDEIARVGGLPDAQYGEILDFNGPVTGLVLDLREDSLGCVLFGAVEHVTQGSLWASGFWAGLWTASAAPSTARAPSPTTPGIPSSGTPPPYWTGNR